MRRATRLQIDGTLIALAWRGQPFVGVIDHPVTSDRWTGVCGRMPEQNGTPVRACACASVDAAYATCSNAGFMTDRERAKFNGLRNRAQYVQYVATCFSYGVLAFGRTGLAIDSGLDSIDAYAAAAVFTGAGG